MAQARIRAFKSEIVAHMPKHWICLICPLTEHQRTVLRSLRLCLVVATSIRFAVIIRYLGGLSFTAVTASAVQGHYPVLRERRFPSFRHGSKNYSQET